MGWIRSAGAAIVAVGTIGVAGVVASCTTPEGTADETARAVALVDATRRAGIAPGLTVDAAIALYGEDAAGFCDVHDGGIDDVSGLVILGNASQGRRPTVTDEAVEYGRLVAQVYCPNVLDDYESTVADLQPFEVRR